MAGPPVGIVRFVEKVREGLQRLRRGMVPPNIAAMDLMTYPWVFQCVHAFIKLGFPDAMDAKNAKSAEELAQTLGTDAGASYRLLRACEPIGLVTKKGGGFVLAPIGAGLRADAPQSVRDFILFQGGMTWDLWTDLHESVRTGKTAIMLREGRQSFEYLNADPVRADLFNNAMSAISRFVADSVIGAYDFSKHRKVADVGGGHGLLLTEILNANPKLTGAVVDLPEVVATAKHKHERLDLIGGSFFETIPVTDAELYLMKSIIHDWNDADAEKILRTVGAAMPAGAKLMLVETVVPETAENHLSKLLDLEMLVVAGGKERTAREYEALFAKSGFRLEEIRPTVGPSSLVIAGKA